ncbi:phasin family protein [Paraburkholderia sp. FT54]|uniref:phasin family protein n=1 Tax=Paraburkholderia sp. FT54 TaxID=3074437 RepID=UPI0028773E78|nr:phasin family protein [Paraburkholderia sp. FT54]WNC93217.1 phasin family protein [Paraburkholderia sp. FT54]
MHPTTLEYSPLFRRDADFPTVFDWVGCAATGLERIVELNVQTVKTSLREQEVLAGAALSFQSFSEVIDLQSQQLPAAVKKTFAYWRHVEEIAVETGGELASVMQASFQRFVATLRAPVDIAMSTARAQGDTSSLLTMDPPRAAAGTAAAILDSSGKIISDNESDGGVD